MHIKRENGCAGWWDFWNPTVTVLSGFLIRLIIFQLTFLSLRVNKI